MGDILLFTKKPCFEDVCQRLHELANHTSPSYTNCPEVDCLDMVSLFPELEGILSDLAELRRELSSLEDDVETKDERIEELTNQVAHLENLLDKISDMTRTWERVV